MRKILCICLVLPLLACSCAKSGAVPSGKKDDTLAQFSRILQEQNLNRESRYTAIHGIAESYLAAKDYYNLILFLTETVEKDPGDMYNAYWLLMTAYAYMETGALPFAEYYFERVIETCGDLLIGDRSAHFLCLQNLIKISGNHQNRISYFNQLISRFPEEVNRTELYYRLATEYEQVGEWDAALKSYTLFLDQPDSPAIQIPGATDAYNHAKRLIDFNNSARDWTFESLEALETAVKNAITNYSYISLDRYRAKVGFFAMSWKQDATDPNSQANFSLRDFMQGNRIRYHTELDESSNPNEAYLRTWGWSQYISVWYLYFRKVNFPVDPDIHGRWEWAGIYYGEKL
ncbi:MAG: tetratricopeptide repeat protein [Spirochaetaceae bacterium]|jgi:tetratricopeptide (TPR) repeat protein|nr:tetratricopeptide repeat protein [Spirochaetaceae bacterium]